MLVWITVGMCLSSSGQTTLSGTITNPGGEGIPDASVRIAGSGKGAKATADGSFEIPNIPYKSFNLLVSSDGFKSKIIPVSLNKSNQVKVVLEKSIRAEASNMDDKSWKKNLKRFERDFVGNSKNAERSRILNPEVLQFERERDRLTAKASDVLEILNEAMGYKIYYLLNEYHSNDNSMYVGGHMFFEEVEAMDEKVKRRWERQREKTYLGSKSHFLKALVSDQLKEQGFSVEEVRDDSKTFRSGRVLNAEQMVRDGEDGFYRFYIRNMIKVTLTNSTAPTAYLNDQLFSIRREMDEVEESRLNEPITSLLTIQVPYILIDEHGFVRDTHHFHEYGYWAWQRVADQLPAEYEPE